MMNEYYYERAVNNRYNRTVVRRREAIFHRRLLMIVLFMIIFTITFFSVKLLTYADDSTDDYSYKKQYKSVTIYCGDSVSSIAREYMGYGYTETALIREICSINNISSGCELTAGNFLIIPYYEVN